MYMYIYIYVYILIYICIYIFTLLRESPPVRTTIRPRAGRFRMQSASESGESHAASDGAACNSTCHHSVSITEWSNLIIFFLSHEKCEALGRECGGYLADKKQARPLGAP